MIHVWDERGYCVMSGDIYDNLHGGRTDEINAVMVDGIEYKRACELLDRKPLQITKPFTFFGDDALTVYVNWSVF